MVVCVILTPFPFYKNIIFFPGRYCSYKSGALFAKFQPDLIHVFLYAGVYCIPQVNFKKKFQDLFSKTSRTHAEHLQNI